MPRQTLAILILLLPLLAAAAEDIAFTRPAHPAPGAEPLLLPRPVEDYETTMRRLSESGLLGGDRTPPEDPQVGDTWLWYIWDLSGYPVATLMPCTVRGMGDHIYVVVEDSQWNVNIDQNDVDTIVEHFDDVSVGDFPDQGVWDLNTGHFGQPPDFDGLDRIFYLYYEFNISADGYFWVYDQYPDGTQAFHSNEADVIYLATDSGDCASDYMMAVGAHEFEHLIHWNQDPNEEIWLDEGMGELAMWLFGNPDHISSFNTNPDNSLVNWGSSWADYIQCYLWTLYIYEQFGGQGVIWDTVHHPANGMYSYQQAIAGLGYPHFTEDIFGDWSVANYLDEPAIYEGQYGYTGDELPPFQAWRTISSFPASGSGSVQDWASEYMRILDGSDGSAPRFVFNGSDTHDFRVRLLAVDAALPTMVEEMSLDGGNDGEFTFNEAAAHDEIIVSVASTTTAGSGSYSYEVDLVPTAVADGAPAARGRLAAWPNPFNPAAELRLETADAGRVAVEFFDLGGRRVDALDAGRREAGAHRLTWRPEGLPSGVYLARLLVDGRPQGHAKLVLAK